MIWRKRNIWPWQVTFTVIWIVLTLATVAGLFIKGGIPWK